MLRYLVCLVGLLTAININLAHAQVPAPPAGCAPKAGATVQKKSSAQKQAPCDASGQAAGQHQAAPSAADSTKPLTVTPAVDKTPPVSTDQHVSNTDARPVKIVFLAAASEWLSENRKVIPEFIQILFFICASSGFGGVVAALQKTHHMRSLSGDYERKYILPCPLNPSKAKKLGYFGDVLVGIAAGIAVFGGLASVSAVSLDTLNLQDTESHKRALGYLKLVGFGVLTGYMGSHVLEQLAMMFSNQYFKKKGENIQEQQKFEDLEKTLTSSDEVNRLRWVGDAFRSYKEYQKALDLYNDALKINPDDLHTVIHKSFAFSALARAAKTPEERKKNYNQAINETNYVIEKWTSADATNVAKRYEHGRGYYNRACYKTLLYSKTDEFMSKKVDILRDLEEACKLDPLLAQMAGSDHDFDALKDDNKFNELLKKYTFQAAKVQFAP